MPANQIKQIALGDLHPFRLAGGSGRVNLNTKGCRRRACLARDRHHRTRTARSKRYRDRAAQPSGPRPAARQLLRLCRQPRKPRRPAGEPGSDLRAKTDRAAERLPPAFMTARNRDDLLKRALQANADWHLRADSEAAQAPGEPVGARVQLRVTHCGCARAQCYRGRTVPGSVRHHLETNTGWSCAGTGRVQAVETIAANTLSPFGG